MSLGTFNPQGPFETRLFINNEFVNSVSGKTFHTVDPSSEEVICAVQEADHRDVDIAVKAAREAFENGPWSKAFGSQRRDWMLKLAQLVDENRAYLAALESFDNGKPANNPKSYTSQGDLHLVIQCLRYYAGWADKIQGKTIPVDGDILVYTRHEPVGVVGQIIPWNFPLLMLAWKIGPALACGCTVVVKTSEKTPLSALALARLIKEAGFPAGVVNVISGFGPTAGEPLARHMDVDKIAFTGSTAIGHKIEQFAAESNLKRVSLELGGKSPLIVMPDADLDQALAAAHVGLFLNQGQCCCASSRLFVHEDIYDTFVEKASAQARARKVLHPSHAECEQGPQVDKIQFDRIMGYIESGKQQGARVVAGGERHGEKGFYIQPTVFADVTDDMKIAREEIFGPVMSILKFKTVDEAIRRANDSIFGLAAGVCSRDIGTALRIANRLRAGVVWVNTYDFFDTASPFGGYKQSGHGRELGEYALSLYTEIKTVVIPIDK